MRVEPFLHFEQKRLSLPCVPELKLVRHTLAGLNFFLKPRCSYQRKCGSETHIVQPAQKTEVAKWSEKKSSYWYSTDGPNRIRIDNAHLATLDYAYETQSKVQLNVGDQTLLASPSTGVLSSGDIHYGLYREPSLNNSEQELFDLGFSFPTDGREQCCQIL
ncbi:hypothetical protein BC936DRAFT_150160 [Jimgerdemannia flammicorona]|uniref:Uncharacterized protein n=1 Tax=Jimgerdemannia flammicorona TaxID=994334 RepID=A0A433CZD3_9FUNG|nr:hypothetical protein BC936DRAFT_150160 [Jimgerdemannia flammicorona]